MSTTWKSISIREEVFDLIVSESKKKIRKPTPHLDIILSKYFGIPSLVEVFHNE